MGEAKRRRDREWREGLRQFQRETREGGFNALEIRVVRWEKWNQNYRSEDDRARVVIAILQWCMHQAQLPPGQRELCWRATARPRSSRRAS
jgi:hypothetical protein